MNKLYFTVYRHTCFLEWGSSRVAALIIILLLFLISNAQAECRLTFSSGHEIYPVALAHTPEQLKRGLSGRDTIDEGMLFVWSDARKLTFWMKNTHQALTLYYLDVDAVIQEILSLEPLSEVYQHSQQPARYALELPEKMMDNANLNYGDRLSQVICP